MLSLMRNDRKYWPRDLGDMASSTLQPGCDDMTQLSRRKDKHSILIKCFHLNHVLHGEYEPFQGDMLLVLDDNNDLVDATLNGPFGRSILKNRLLRERNAPRPALLRLPSPHPRCIHSEQDDVTEKPAYRTSVGAQTGRRDRLGAYRGWYGLRPRLTRF